MCCGKGRPHQVDSLWSWVVCGSALMCNLLVLGLVYSFGILYPALMKDLNESRGRTALVGSLAIFCTYVGGIPASVMCDRFGCRPTAFLGSLACSLGLLATSYVNTLWMMYFTFSLLFGCGSCCVLASSYVITIQYFDRKRSTAIGLVGAGLALGIMILSPLIQILLDTVQLKKTLRILAGIDLISCVAALTFSPTVEEEGSRIIQEELGEVYPSLDQKDIGLEIRGTSEGNANSRGMECICSTDIDGEICSSKVQVRLIEEKRVDGVGGLHVDKGRSVINPMCANNCQLWTPAFAAYSLSSCISFFGFFVPQIHLAVYCEDQGISSDMAAWLYVFLGLASLLARVTSGPFLDRMSIKKRYVQQLSLVCCGTAVLLCPLATVYPAMVVFAVVFGFFNGSFVTVMDVLILASVPAPLRAKAFGTYLMCLSVFVATGPPVAGFLADVLSSYDMAFYLAGTMILCGACIPFVLVLSERHEMKTIMGKEFEVEKIIIAEKLTVL